MFKKISLFTLGLAKISLGKENDDFSPESSFDYDPYDYSYAYEYEAANQHLDTDHDSPADIPEEAGFRAILGGPNSEGRSSPRGPRPDGPLSIGSEGGPSGDPVADRNGLRRLQERLALIHHLVGHPRYHHSINALRYYGCWCLPHMRDDDAPGQVIPHKGKPADAVDSACMKAQKCYECAYRDHEQHVDKKTGKNYRCISRGNGYAYNLHFDQNDFANRDKRSIECMDDPNDDDIRHSCRRSLCECDRQFAEDLRAGMGEWKEENRQKMQNIPGTGGLKEWVGGFDPKDKCVASGNGSGDNAGQKPDQCCGFKGGVRLPFYSNQGRVKCCGDKTYDSLIYTCCEDGRLTMANTC